MKKTAIIFCLCLAAMLGVMACKKKAPAPNAVTIESSSVTVDSVSPDSALVIVEDTTVTVGVVPDGEAPAKKK